jgi:membrane fusion protein (multidrug efflux system)
VRITNIYSNQRIRMNKKLRITMTVILILFLTGIILYPKFKPFIVAKFGPKNIQTPLLRQAQQRLNATGYLIAPQNLSEFIKSNGTLRPDEEVDLSFETSGKIIGINFTEGTKVEKGDLLAKINDKPLQAELQKLEAELKMAEAKEFRQRSLLDKDAISQESYDQIVTDVQTIRADINLVKARISETELRAPFDGKIGLRYVSEGAYTTSSTKIARLVKTSPIKIEFSIPEKYATEINIGYPITFEVDGIIYNASVYAIDPKIDILTRVISLRALYPNKNEELKPGRYTSITLELSKIDNAIAIPTEALIPEMEGEKVYIYQRGKAQSVKVIIGLRTESKIQITDGLKFGDTLLVTGILQLRQNLPIVLDSVIVNK